MICPNCKNEQAEGKFCGQCGSVLPEKIEETPVEPTPEPKIEKEEPVAVAKEEPATIVKEEPVRPTSPVPPTPTVAKNSAISDYWAYFLNSFKKPTQTAKEAPFNFALFSMGIMVLLWAVLPFVALQRVLTYTASWFNSSVGNTAIDISILVKALVTFIILYACIIAVVSLLTTKMGKYQSWKQVVSIIGTYNNWVIVLLLFSFIPLFMNFFAFTSSLVSIASLFIVLLIPVYVAIIAFESEHKLDRFVRFLIMLGALFAIYYVLYKILLNQVIDSMRSFTNFM